MHKKIDEETQRYQAQHGLLAPKFAGQVIAMLQGEVVEVGDSYEEVNRIVRERFGDEAVLITRVGAEPLESVVIRSPRFEATAIG